MVHSVKCAEKLDQGRIVEEYMDTISGDTFEEIVCQIY